MKADGSRLPVGWHGRQPDRAAIRTVVRLPHTVAEFVRRVVGPKHERFGPSDRAEAADALCSAHVAEVNAAFR